MNTVVNKIIAQCREAMLSGIPIVYIKTDSDVLIRQIIENEDEPLVQLLCGDKGGNELENRPLNELKASGKNVTINDAKNYSNKSKNNNLDSLSYPNIWTYKMPEINDSGCKEVFQWLEQYVLKHEDMFSECYDFLQYSVVLLYSSSVNISASLSPYTKIIEVDYPDEEEIRSIIKSKSFNAHDLDEERLSELCTEFAGFSTEEISLIMQRICVDCSFSKKDKAKVQKIILDRKKQKMAGGILEFCEVGTPNMGGMVAYKKWLEDTKDKLVRSAEYQKKLSTKPPRGVLFCGIPGCGKSQAAKFTAGILGLPLLNMDVGSLMDKYVGGSEQKMRDALKTAEVMSPCVLWIDELEKAFSAAGESGKGSSATFKRMFGYMLHWMQENDKPCFIFATANDIGGLPKEFFRSGRFDALFATYLPTLEECADIIISCMKQAEKNVKHSLFETSCYKKEMLYEVLNSNLVDKEKKPRIVIGSDLKQITDIALRSQIERTSEITGIQWKTALSNAISNDIKFYGDGKENVASIAASYCRMLRKNFRPTSDMVLFKSDDYHTENEAQLRELKSKQNPYDIEDEEEEKKYKKRLENAQILQKPKSDSKTDIVHSYDKAVYDLLYREINLIAPRIEQIETEKMLGR